MGSVEFLRSLFGSSFSDETSSTSTFIGALPLDGKFPFSHTRQNLIWIGSDATLDACATIGFSNKIYTRFGPKRLISTLLIEHLTGSTEDLIIAVTELCSFAIFLMIEPIRYTNKLVAYTGDNQNAVTWLGKRKARNALARFSSRIIPRLERKYGFHVRRYTFLL